MLFLVHYGFVFEIVVDWRKTIDSLLKKILFLAISIIISHHSHKSNYEHQIVYVATTIKAHQKPFNEHCCRKKINASPQPSPTNHRHRRPIQNLSIMKRGDPLCDLLMGLLIDNPYK